MKEARIVIGANYGDEGKGTVVAHYAKNATNVLNILTNGGSQRGHSILTEYGSTTFQHFGSGTYHGADSYYSCYFILNPMQFVKEHEALVIKPQNIYRDASCRWSTPYDSMANLITEQLRGRHASCGMGIWFTIKRYRELASMTFDEFLASENPYTYLDSIKHYYETFVPIPDDWKATWNSFGIQQHFLEDCKYMATFTKVAELAKLGYDNLIFENGQGLLLSDTGKDTYDTTPSNTGIEYSLELLKSIPDVGNITAHYVTRPYLTRHGDGAMEQESNRAFIASSVAEDRTNHFNDFQGQFRYGNLNIESLHQRIQDDARGVKVELEVTHCDEMDRIAEFRRQFGTVNTYDSALIS